MKIDHWIIDADTHVTEPAGVWTDRLAAKYLEKAPRLVRLDDGTDVWRFGDFEQVVPVGYTALAGWPEPYPSAPKNMDEIPAAAHDATARLAYMDEVGIWAMTLYPNIGGFGNQAFLHMDDPQLRLACVLVIDPELSYSTYLGGASSDYATSIAVDSTGSAYITGYTASANFPVTTGSLQTSCGGGSCVAPNYDAFVTKLNSSGTALIYSTYLGGSSQDYGYGIAVDGSGDAYIVGTTFSGDFPVTAGAYQTTCKPALNIAQVVNCTTGDVFVTELNPAGSALVYSTYIGGSTTNEGDAIAIDSGGNAYITGYTKSANYPVTTGVFQSKCSSCSKALVDAIVTKLNAGGATLGYSTFLGGNNADVGYAITLDSSDNAYITGYTYSTNFPTSKGAFETTLGGPTIAALVEGIAPEAAVALSGLKSNQANIALMAELAQSNRLLAHDHELGAILRALDGDYIRPAPGGDLLRTPEVLPTGRNMHGFDPFLIPSAIAVRDGARQAQTILDRHQRDTGSLPESIAIVLWGSDNLKSEGAPIAQAMTLLGARPRFDGYGRLCGAALIPLEELGRPRVDVLITLSGIFRDLLALQTRMLAEAAFLAASADEPVAMNFIRKHALDYQREHGGDLETAALRVFSNADGAYGANVNQLIDASCWTEEDELADAYQARKCFAYGRDGAPVRQSSMLQDLLTRVDLAYQNVESVELGVTTIDHYVDTLGGISRAVRRARGVEAPVYIGDQTSGEAKVRTLSEQVALETHTRMLNPRWYEGLLNHGYEGVRQIEAQVTNTMGWSATTGQVAPWIYQRISETYLLDEAMRDRLANLNPVASVRMARRLLEACDRKLWKPDDATLRALQNASDELEDRLEGVPHAA